MNPAEQPRVESEAISDFDQVMRVGRGPLSRQPPEGHTPAATAGHGGRLNLDAEKVKNGLGQLVLTIVKLLHELLERQAIRRIDAGSLSDDEIERLGETLMKQAQEIERLRKEFNLEEEDLNLDLGPLGKLL
jgi:hypothetical protein